MPLHLSGVETQDIPQLIRRVDEGETHAPAKLLSLIYDELRKLAAAKMARESGAHTLQPTALVHEVWLRLNQGSPAPWKNRAHYFAAAAEAMRRILIEKARRRAALRHGGSVEKISMDAVEIEICASEMNEAKLLLLNEALENLAVVEPRKAELVKQCYFVGLTVAEAAEALGISQRTAERDWHFARAWLVQEMERLAK